MLDVAKLHTPELFPFIYFCYSILSSALLKVALCCSALLSFTQIFYLDDATLGAASHWSGASPSQIRKLICADQAGLALLHLAPDFCRVRPNATLLGSPVGLSVVIA